MMKFFKQVRSNEDGATAIEYGLIAALIAIALIATLDTLSGTIDGLFGQVGTELTAETNEMAAE